MNRAELIKFLKSLGYDGKAELKAIQAWLTENGYDSETIAGRGGKTFAIADAWKKTATATSDAEGDDDRESDADAGKARIAELEAQVKTLTEKSRLAGDGGKRVAQIDGDTDTKEPAFRRAKSYWNAAARKNYDRQAALGKTVFPDADLAELGGASMRLCIAGHKSYEQKTGDLEILKKSQFEYDNLLGGALVPVEMSPYLISLKEQYVGGKVDFRRVAMSRDVQTFDKDTGDLTVYAPGEGVAITASQGTFATVTLTAKKLATLTTLSSEIMRDSAINMADLTGRKIMYAFAKAEEQCFYIGDGTSTYYGFQGVNTALKGLSGTIANIAGLYVGTGNAYSELTLNDFIYTAGLLPDFQGVTSEAAWYMNKRFWFGTVRRLALAAGGVTTGMIEGKQVEMLLGSPVVFRRSMPRTEGNSQVCALYGHLDLAGTVGDVTGGVSIDTSTERYFDQDLIAVRGIERVAFSPHDVGNASATEASRNPGPVVGLITAAS